MWSNKYPTSYIYSEQDLYTPDNIIGPEDMYTPEYKMGGSKNQYTYRNEYPIYTQDDTENTYIPALKEYSSTAEVKKTMKKIIPAMLKSTG